MRKYDLIDWKSIQEAHNKGMGWKDISKNFSICNVALSWGRKNDKLQFRNQSSSLKLAHKLGKIDYSPYRTNEFRKKQSKFGGYKENSGRCSHIIYTKKDNTNVKIQGSWELKMAKFLDEKNIIWNRNRIGYKYDFDGKSHLYFPDFYLKDLDLYIEVKGYETDKDKEKWKQFPFTLIIVKKKEIQDLETWWKEI